eukprot:746763-Hanusia_phi.AAC.2
MRPARWNSPQHLRRFLAEISDVCLPRVPSHSCTSLSSTLRYHEHATGKNEQQKLGARGLGRGRPGGDGDVDRLDVSVWSPAVRGGD